ncbi:N-acetyltransferase family protein [Streptomyces sp. AC555_RSS877]|uniref:GNAT family N-acetyltransferase n=1 Tax=Streptomyces sp. AC555_RSS877 TaxID=2823688 RepID=UPI0027E41D8F|nr:N-acetyltransferase family protein [Streptomyces sp. AC555_RSS877]
MADIYVHYVLNTVATFEVEPPSAERWLQRFEDLGARGLPFLVVVAADEVAGYSYAAPWRPKPSNRHVAEDAVYLSPKYVGRGLGTKLLEALVKASAGCGLRQMIAVIADTGDDASPPCIAASASSTWAD